MYVKPLTECVVQNTLTYIIAYKILAKHTQISIKWPDAPKNTTATNCCKTHKHKQSDTYTAPAGFICESVLL
jgi:hypothetical protein